LHYREKDKTLGDTSLYDSWPHGRNEDSNLSSCSYTEISKERGAEKVKLCKITPQQVDNSHRRSAACGDPFSLAKPKSFSLVTRNLLPDNKGTVKFNHLPGRYCKTDKNERKLTSQDGVSLGDLSHSKQERKWRKRQKESENEIFKREEAETGTGFVKW
jgi:hypothetical protein